VKTIKRGVKLVWRLGDAIAEKGKFHLDEIAKEIKRKLDKEKPNDNHDLYDITEQVVENAHAHQLYKNYPNECDKVWDRKLKNLENAWTDFQPFIDELQELYNMLEQLTKQIWELPQDKRRNRNGAWGGKGYKSGNTYSAQMVMIENILKRVGSLFKSFNKDAAEIFLGLAYIKIGHGDSKNQTYTCYGKTPPLRDHIVIIEQRTMEHMWTEH
jgi:hypothetical protein